MGDVDTISGRKLLQESPRLLWECVNLGIIGSNDGKSIPGKPRKNPRDSDRKILTVCRRNGDTQFCDLDIKGTRAHTLKEDFFCLCVPLAISGFVVHVPGIGQIGNERIFQRATGIMKKTRCRERGPGNGKLGSTTNFRGRIRCPCCTTTTGGQQQRNQKPQYTRVYT